MQNARFWTFINGDWVKLTLAPGYEITHTEGGPTDEGFHREWNTWAHTGEGVERTWETSSRDCDGRLDRSGECCATLEQLRARNIGEYGPNPGALVPEWTECDSRQRDYNAEAAGY